MSKEYDIFRDSYLRYLGYANEVGESFRPLVRGSVVNFSYMVATGYVLSDTIDKAYKAAHKPGANGEKMMITAGDVLTWQMLASVIIPGFTINRITWLTGRLLRKATANKTLIKAVPTTVGLASIPLIIHPIDHFVDYLMDNTYRKWIKPS